MGRKNANRRKAAQDEPSSEQMDTVKTTQFRVAQHIQRPILSTPSPQELLSSGCLPNYHMTFTQ